MQTTEVQNNRIETYTAALPQAVQKSNGAQFALMLSLISANQQPSTGFSVVANQPSASEQVEEPRYPTAIEVNTPPLVERLNDAIHRLRFGDFAYINSFIDTMAQTPRPSVRSADSFEKVALLSSGRLMLNEIERGQSAFHAAV